jgi:hypothetical protein
MPLPVNCCSTLFTTGYKRPPEDGRGAFAFAFGFYLLLWGFLVWEAFGREKISEGKKLLKRG